MPQSRSGRISKRKISCPCRGFETRTFDRSCFLYQPRYSGSSSKRNKIIYTNLQLHNLKRGPGSSVDIATDYGLDGPGSNPSGDEIFRPSRPALGPTQPPVKWVPGLSRGVKRSRGVLLTTHPLLVPRSLKSRAIPLPTLWATPGL